MTNVLDDFLWGLSNCDKVVIVLTGVGEKEFSTKEIYEAINELKAKADKWDEKETPYKPKEIFNSTMVLDNVKYSYGDCKCSFRVFEHQKYCLNCGQKLDWESEGE